MYQTQGDQLLALPRYPVMVNNPKNPSRGWSLFYPSFSIIFSLSNETFLFNKRKNLVVTEQILDTAVWLANRTTNGFLVFFEQRDNHRNGKKRWRPRRGKNFCFEQMAVLLFFGRQVPQWTRHFLSLPIDSPLLLRRPRENVSPYLLSSLATTHSRRPPPPLCTSVENFVRIWQHHCYPYLSNQRTFKFINSILNNIFNRISFRKQRGQTRETICDATETRDMGPPIYRAK